jgi:hypothetical protein
MAEDRQPKDIGELEQYFDEALSRLRISELLLNLALTVSLDIFEELFRTAQKRIPERFSAEVAMLHYKSALEILIPHMIGEYTRPNLLVIEDLGMRRLPATAAEDLLEIFVRRYEKGSIIISSNRPLEDWGKSLGDNAAAGAILDRFLHHAEVIKLDGKSHRMYDRRELRRLNKDNPDLTEKTE